jgi:Zn-dependent protease
LNSSGDLKMHAIFRWFVPFFSGLFLGLIAMAAHECGHVVAALALGVRVKRVGVQWNRGMFTVREQGSAVQNLIIALAGPSVNLFLIALEPWFPLFGLANVCCVLANMLPMQGSDGYRVAMCWRQIRLEGAADK